MCTTSNQLKLCTCATSLNLNTIDHWVLKQGENNQDGISYASATLGMCVMPNDIAISATADKANVEKLSAILNANYCFDKEMRIKHGDTLTLYFIEKKSSPELNYTFKYEYNKWVFDKWANTFNSRPEMGKGIIETNILLDNSPKNNIIELFDDETTLPF
jgi:hypothetical protein